MPVYKTFCVIRFSSMGDVLMTTPVLRVLKKRFPGCRIVYITKPAYAPLVQHSPYVDEVVVLEGSLLGLAMKLASYSPSCLIDLHDTVRSRTLSAMLFWVKTLRTDNGRREREAMVRTEAEMKGEVSSRHLIQLKHMAERHLAAVASLGIEDDGQGLDFFLPPNMELPLGVVPFYGDHNYVAVGIGGQHFTKRLPEAKLVQLLRSIHAPVVLMGGAEDADAGARAAGTLALEGRWNIVNACGKLDLLQTGLVIAGAEQVYSHDTGTMHMAAALRRPITAIWGSTVPEFGMHPFRILFQNKQVDLPCRPCHKHGREACPLGHFRCMEGQVF